MDWLLLAGGAPGVLQRTRTTVIVGALCLAAIAGAAAGQENETAAFDPTAADAIAESLRLGQEAMAQRDFVAAQDHFACVLQLDWNNPQVYEWWQAARDSAAVRSEATIRYGDRLFARGEYAEALVHYHEALRADPENRDLQRRIYVTGRKIYSQRYLVAGLDAYVDQQYTSARTLLDSALIFDPENRTAAALRALVLQPARSGDNPVDLKDDPEAWALHLAALKAYRAGEFAAAIQQWENILIKYARHPEVEANIHQARLRLPTNNSRPATMAADEGNP